MKLQHAFLLCGITALTGVSIQAQAQTQQGQPAGNISASDTQNAIKEPVVKLYQALSAAQHTSKHSPSQSSALLKQALDTSYDFPTIIGKTVGYRYNSFTPQEKDAVLNAFKKYTVARYLSGFTEDADTQFKISPDIKHTTINDRQIVSTTIGSGSDTTQIDYIVQNTPQGWKIIDVLLNGNISQTAVQHGDFSSTLAKGGSQALIQMLDKKTQSFNK